MKIPKEKVLFLSSLGFAILEGKREDIDIKLFSNLKLCGV